MRPASRGGKRNASAWLLLCRRRGRQCDGEWIASHPGPAKGGDWESEEGNAHPLGFKWSIIHTAIPLPFVSYTGTRVLWYIGWQKAGNFGLKFNLLNSKVQVV